MNTGGPKNNAFKNLPFIIGALFGIWGVFLVIHFIGRTGITDFISIFVGLGLIAVGIISAGMFIRGRRGKI